MVRTTYYKYHHPKEVLIATGVLNRELNRVLGKAVQSEEDTEETPLLTFLFPFGATLNVQKPAVPVLSTGTVSLPVNRPVCSFYEHQVTVFGLLFACS